MTEVRIVVSDYQGEDYDIGLESRNVFSDIGSVRALISRAVYKIVAAMEGGDNEERVFKKQLMTDGYRNGKPEAWKQLLDTYQNLVSQHGFNDDDMMMRIEVLGELIKSASERGGA